MLSGEGLIAVVGNPRRRMPGRNAKGRFVKRGHSARRNPKRARHHAAKRRHSSHRARAHSNPRRRRRAHHNPRFGIPSGRMIQSTLGGALVGAGGALALDLGLTLGRDYLPAVVATPGWPRNLLRLGGAFLIGALSGFLVKPETRRAITAGAVTVVTYSIVKDLANQYVLPASMQLAGEDDSTGTPWAWNPYLSRLGHGGSSSSGAVDGLRGYIAGPRPRGFNMPRVRAGAGATASRMSSYMDDGVTSPSGSLGADVEI